MRKQLFALGVLALATLLATSAFAASRGVEFLPVGLFPMCDEVPPGEFCDNFPLTTAVSMSGDGQIITGMHAFFSGGYRWTEETGLQNLGPVNGGVYVSSDGSTIASTFFDDTFSWGWSAIWAGGFYPDMTWDRTPLMPGFSPCGGSGQSLYDVNGDGSITVGLSWEDLDGNGNGCDGATAYITQGGATTMLENSVNNDSTRANAVNADGSVIVGWMQTNSREASKWVNGVQSFLCPNAIGAGGDQFCSEGWDVTPDGSAMLTSMATPADFNTRATIVYADGSYEQLPFPDAPFDPFWDSFQGWAISDDGNTVVGEFGGGGFFGSPPYPVVWNRDLGFTLDLQLFLIGQGLDDLFFWFLDDATTVSADGKLLAGSGGNPDGWIEAYRVDLTKVKVCHKPDGNDRTLAINWDSVPDHLAHGDLLSTCEFAGGGGSSSRALDARLTSINEDPTADGRIGTIEELNRLQRAAGQGGFGVTGHQYPTNGKGMLDKAPAQDSRKRSALEDRIRHQQSR
jgi:hypothetical protein